MISQTRLHTLVAFGRWFVGISILVEFLFVVVFICDTDIYYHLIKNVSVEVGFAILFLPSIVLIVGNVLQIYLVSKYEDRYPSDGVLPAFCLPLPMLFLALVIIMFC